MNSPQTKSNHIRGQLHFTLIFTRLGLFSLVFCCPKPLTKQELIRLDCKTFHHWIILNKVVIGNGNWTKRTLMSLQFVCHISCVCYNFDCIYIKVIAYYMCGYNNGMSSAWTVSLKLGICSIRPAFICLVLTLFNEWAYLTKMPIYVP